MRNLKVGENKWSLSVDSPKHRAVAGGFNWLEDNQYWIKGIVSKSSQCGVAVDTLVSTFCSFKQNFFPPRSPSKPSFFFPPETTEGFKPPAVRLRSTNRHSLPERVGEGYVDAEVTLCLVNAVHTQPQASWIATTCCKCKDCKKLRRTREEKRKQLLGWRGS